MSGTGKSTLLGELARRGHRVVDTDEPGWSEEVPLPGGGVEQLWVEPRMAALLAEETPVPLFVAGCVRNQGRFRGRFDEVVLLTAPVDVLVDRIAARTTNPFGKDPAERARILRDLAEVEPLLRATSTRVVRTDRPLQEVADEVAAIMTA